MNHDMQYCSGYLSSDFKTMMKQTSFFDIIFEAERENTVPSVYNNTLNISPIKR